MQRRKSLAKRRRIHRFRQKRIYGEAAYLRGEAIAKQVAKVLTILQENKKILYFEIFAKHSPEDRWGWDFMITMPDHKRVPVDVTTTNPRTLNDHLIPKPHRRERLVIPVDIFTPLDKLESRIWQAVKNYDKKLPPLMSEIANSDPN